MKTTEQRPDSMLAGGEITAEETLAIQLWYTYLKERGDVFNVHGWLKGVDPVYLTAQKWLYLTGSEKDAWLAVARKAQELAA